MFSGISCSIERRKYRPEWKRPAIALARARTRHNKNTCGMSNALWCAPLFIPDSFIFYTANYTLHYCPIALSIEFFIYFCYFI